MTCIKLVKNEGKPTVLAVAGWGTGHALFEALYFRYQLVSVVPTDPHCCVRDIHTYLQANQINPSLAIGVSMGACLSVEIGIKKCIVVGINFGFPAPVLKAIRRQIDLIGCDYVSSFHTRCVTSSEDQLWIENMGYEPWTVAALKSGLTYLGENHWPVVGGRPSRIVHASDDGISPYDPVKKWATSEKIPLTTLNQVGHLPFGPTAVTPLISVIEHELAH